MRNFLGQDHKDEKLKGKIEELSQPPLGEIRVIVEGTSAGQSSKSRKTYLKMVQNVQLSERPPRTRGQTSRPILIDEDAGKVHHRHDDVIVITLLIAEYTTRRVLIDNGNSANILYSLVVQQMRLGLDQLRPVNSPLVRFGGM